MNSPIGACRTYSTTFRAYSVGHRKRSESAPGDKSERDATFNDTRTLDYILRYLNEGAPGHAFRLVTSHGIHDASEPTVLQRLWEIHPTDDPLPIPHPMDRPDSPPDVTEHEKPQMKDLI